MSMTVRALKELLANWPEEDERGDPTEVWMMTGRGTSSPVVGHSLLGASDLLLGCNQWPVWTGLVAAVPSGMEGAVRFKRWPAPDAAQEG